MARAPGRARGMISINDSAREGTNIEGLRGGKLMKISVGNLFGTRVGAQPVEVVERKGLGHPDSICDALCERLSNDLSRYYLDRHGAILHHNVDKCLLFGGVASPAFGGGEVRAPIEIYLSGRAAGEWRGASTPIEEIATEGCRRWFEDHLHAIDAQRHVRVHCLVRPTSAGLAELFARPGGAANDTSVAVGYAPLDELEQTVLHVERHLNCTAVKREHPEIGEDIKIMGVRHEGRIALTVACAFVDRHVAGMAEYAECKRRLAERVREAAAATTALPLDVVVNMADGTTPESLYLTVTGTSAEAGDDGEAGRGNRVNGLITPYRPMTMEAVAGKNPVTHVGKLYNVLASRLAQQIVDRVPGVVEAYCCLVSRIGAPVGQPQLADVRVRVIEPIALSDLRPQIGQIVEAGMASAGTLWRELLSGEHRWW